MLLNILVKSERVSQKASITKWMLEWPLPIGSRYILTILVVVIVAFEHANSMSESSSLTANDKDAEISLLRIVILKLMSRRDTIIDLPSFLPIYPICQRYLIMKGMVSGLCSSSADIGLLFPIFAVTI